MRKKYRVRLTGAEREALAQLIRSGTAPARSLTCARLLLKADEAEGGPAWTNAAMAQALEVTELTVTRVRRRFAEGGLERALHRKEQARRKARKLDGAQEAHLLALTCSAAPEGHPRWSLRLLADKMVELGQIDELSHETVRQVLKKGELKPWLKRQWCIPPKASGEFVARMEDLLAVYHRPYDPKRPLVCLDEKSKELHRHAREPLPMEPGKPARQDYEYVRNGTANLFMLFEPLAGWRRVKVTERRTRQDGAAVVQELVEVHYPEAETIVLVLDNLNTHPLGSLYETFAPEEARRIAARLELHYTPQHGSWLNMAEIESSILGRQCLSERIPDQEAVSRQTTAWEAARNARSAKTQWRFTTQDARIKLKHLYPTLQP